MTIDAITIPKLIEDYQANTNASDAQLSGALGYASPAVISLIKQGKMNLPINKVTALAEAVAADPGFVLRAALAATSPDLLAALYAALPSLAWDREETKLVETIRKIKGDRKVCTVVFDGSSVVALLAV